MLFAPIAAARAGSHSTPRRVPARAARLFVGPAPHAGVMLFRKLDLEPSPEENRRVLAVLAFLRG